MFGKYDFFHHPVIVILAHRYLAGSLIQRSNIDSIALYPPLDTSQSNGNLRHNSFFINGKPTGQWPFARVSSLCNQPQTINRVTVFVTPPRQRSANAHELFQPQLGYTSKHEQPHTTKRE